MNDIPAGGDFAGAFDGPSRTMLIQNTATTTGPNSCFSSFPQQLLQQQQQQRPLMKPPIHTTNSGTGGGASISPTKKKSTAAYPLLPPPPRAPSRLPPKSPASMSNSHARRLLSVGSGGSDGGSSSSRSGRSSPSSKSSRKGRRSRSSSRSRRRSRSSSRGRGGRNSTPSTDPNSSFESSSDTDTDQDLPQSQAPPPIQDPTPEHLSIETDTDDLSNAVDFSLLTFEQSSAVPINGVNTTAAPSDVNGNAVDPLTGMASSTPSHSHGRRAPRLLHPPTQHRRLGSWDNSMPPDQSAAATSGVSSGKSCLVIPKILRRGNQRVQVADVASVGNASDTLVSVNSNVAAEVWQSKPGGRITGRELHETAKALLNDGDYEQALHLFEAILKAQQDRFGGEEHSSVGAALHNVGVARLRMGEHQAAEDVLLRAKAVRRSVLGANHLDLAATLAKLGSARTALQKFDEGLGDLREALQITRKLLGRNHRTVAQIQCHIACLYFEAGEMFSAQATFEDALDIYRGNFQAEELADRDAVMAQMTETLCNIGSIQNKRKNFSGAIDSFREAVDLQQGIMGHDHPRVIASLDNLGYSFSKSKSYNQALACYKQMLTAQISHHGSFTIDCCDTLKKQSLIYDKLKNEEAAVEAVTSHLEMIKGKSDLSLGDPVLLELEQMLVDLKSAKKRSGRSKTKKTESRRRDRSLDCFDRILFDRSSRLSEF